MARRLIPKADYVECAPLSSSATATCSTAAPRCRATAWRSTVTGCSRWRPTPTSTRTSCPARRWSTWPGDWCCRGSRTPTCTRCRAASSGPAATSPRRPRRRRPTSPWSAPTPRRTRTGRGCWAAAGRCRPSARPARPRAALDEVVADRPVFLPNRDHHGAWVNSLALRLAGITRDTPDPVDGRHRARRLRCPDRHPARGRDGPGAAADPGHHRRRARRRPAGRADLPALAGRHRLAGRDPRDVRRQRRPGVGVPAGRRGRCADRPGAGCAVVGARPRPRAGRGAARAAGAVHPRPALGRHGQGHAGRCRGELHRRDVAALPRRSRRPDPQHRPVVRRPRAAARGGHPAGRGRLPGARARHRGPGGRRGAGRVRGRPRRQRPLRAGGTTSRTCRWSRPPTGRGSPSWT